MKLDTQYLGLKLRSPLVVSASPLSREVDHLKTMEDAGAGAIVLYSLFEEQTAACRANYEFGSLIGPDAYLDHIVAAKRSVGTPVIASLNATSADGWRNLTRQIEQAGADALELNIYHIPNGAEATAEDIEDEYLEIVRTVRSETTLPLAVKLSPYFTNFANLAGRLDTLGPEGLVLFNRFYQPDIDIEEMMPARGVVLSNSSAMQRPMHWISNLYGNVKANLAATGGILTATDVIKMIMAGSSVTMLCSALMRHGINYLQVMENEIMEWLEQHQYHTLDEIRGKVGLFNQADMGELDRAQYIHALSPEFASIDGL